MSKINFLKNFMVRFLIICFISITMNMSVCQRINIVNCKYKFINITPTFYINEVTLDLEIEVENTNEVYVVMDSIDMDFYINDTKVADGKPTFIDTINAREFDTLSITMNLSYIDLGESIWNAIQKDSTKYKLEGTVFLNTEYGEYNFPVTIIEEEL